MIVHASATTALPADWHIPLITGLPSLATVAMLALAAHAIYLHYKLTKNDNKHALAYSVLPPMPTPSAPPMIFNLSLIHI